MNLLNAQRLTCYWDTTEKLSNLVEKKLLIRTVFVLTCLTLLTLKRRIMKRVTGVRQ